ncbi:uncharacterized protein DS421_1g15840 [Arachis hypogaea]|nr:uncharacterized protein DS421_1g15840 [Arachis hypogaea]
MLSDQRKKLASLLAVWQYSAIRIDLKKLSSWLLTHHPRRLMGLLIIFYDPFLEVRGKKVHVWYLANFCISVLLSESLRPLSERYEILFSISPYTEWEGFEAVVKALSLLEVPKHWFLVMGETGLWCWLYPSLMQDICEEVSQACVQSGSSSSPINFATTLDALLGVSAVSLENLNPKTKSIAEVSLMWEMYLFKISKIVLRISQRIHPTAIIELLLLEYPSLISPPVSYSPKATGN